jgi:hypothetical protein
LGNPIVNAPVYILADIWGLPSLRHPPIEILTAVKTLASRRDSVAWNLLRSSRIESAQTDSQEFRRPGGIVITRSRSERVCNSYADCLTEFICIGSHAF